FQAEDGIRDFHVTGVQTCALPISGSRRRRLRTGCGCRGHALQRWKARTGTLLLRGGVLPVLRPIDAHATTLPGRALVAAERALEIGRASCRERVEVAVVGESLRQK